MIQRTGNSIYDSLDEMSNSHIHILWPHRQAHIRHGLRPKSLHIWADLKSNTNASYLASNEGCKAVRDTCCEVPASAHFQI